MSPSPGNETVGRTAVRRLCRGGTQLDPGFTLHMGHFILCYRFTWKSVMSEKFASLGGKEKKRGKNSNYNERDSKSFSPHPGHRSNTSVRILVRDRQAGTTH